MLPPPIRIFLVGTLITFLEGQALARISAATASLGSPNAGMIMALFAK